MLDLLEGVLEEFVERAVCDYSANEHIGFSVVRGFRDIEPSKGIAWLRSRGENWQDRGDPLHKASDEFVAERREYSRAWKAGPKGRAAYARRGHTPRVRREPGAPKACSVCHVVKELQAFARSGGALRKSACNACRRAARSGK